MTENPYSSPFSSSPQVKVKRTFCRSDAITSSCFVAIFLAIAGTVAGYWLSRIEDNPGDKRSVILFCFVAGSIIGLGSGYLTGRVLCGAIPTVYASGGLLVIAIGLLVDRNPNYEMAERLIAYLAIAGVGLMNATVFVWRRLLQTVC